MGSTWLALRADLRVRWRATLGLALLLGLIGGVVLTAAAGARRTDTAYPRLLRWSRAASVLVVPNCVGLGGFYGGLARLPQVASIWTGVVYSLALPPPAPPGSQLEAGGGAGGGRTGAGPAARHGGRPVGVGGVRRVGGRGRRCQRPGTAAAARGSGGAAGPRL